MTFKKVFGAVLVSAMMMTLVACGGNDKQNGTSNGGTTTESGQVKNDVSIDTIRTAVVNAYGEENYIPMAQQLDETALADLVGLKKDMYDEVVAEQPMVSFSVDTFIAVKAKDGKVEDVKKALEAYRQAKVDDVMQYPTNVPKIEASEVVTYGNYVFYIMLGEMPMDAETDEAMLKAAKENNQKAIQAIEGVLK